MLKDLKILQYRNAAKHLLYNFSLILTLPFLLFACGREDLVQPADDGLPPAIPQQLYVYGAQDGQIGLEWERNTEPDLSNYLIYRSAADTLHFSLEASTYSNYYVDDSLDYKTKYYYYITAVDTKDRESGKTNIVWGRPENKYRPYGPRDVQINGRNWNSEILINLSWTPSYSSDVDGYEIYRAAIPDFQLDSLYLHDFTKGINYDDTTGIELLQTYYYTVVAVDKGGLKSSLPQVISDFIYDKPRIIFPEINSRVDYFNEFEIVSCGKPATYKLVLQTNPVYNNPVFETEITSEILNDTLGIPFNFFGVDAYKTYYWRVFVYSGNSTEPNTFTDLYSFAIYPKP